MLNVFHPVGLSPFDRPAIFSIVSSTPSADARAYINAVLTDVESGTVLAARRIRLDDEGSALFDAAPVLRRALRLQPAAGATGLIASESRFLVQLTVNRIQPDGSTGKDIKSLAVTLISTASERSSTSLVGSRPAQRTIRYGESDMLTFYSAHDFTVTVEVHTPAGSSRSDYFWDGDKGLVTLRLRTSDFAPDAGRITVRLNDSIVAEYDVEPASGEGMRLAWRTESGIIEHHTFPVVARRTLVSGSRSVRLADGTCTLCGQAHTEAVLRSAYENAATVAAIAGAAASPQVWAVDSETGEYVSVEVVTQQVATHSFGEPSDVELTVRPSQNGVRI